MKTLAIALSGKKQNQFVFIFFIFFNFSLSRQPTDGQVIGSGSCGVGVILSVLDFMTSVEPKRVSPSWSFNEMTVHRKDIMKLLSST